jgi:dienelactone hydrolase
MKDGRKLAWKEAIREFRDVTGRQGPSTWQLGTYPEGRGDFPVSGVSWYEAAAYAEFAGKSLPTVYHWYRAAIGYGAYSEILSLSNFSGKGPASVGSHQGLGPFGTYDMAGNVKEWCWNETGNRRVIRGGAWSDASYMSYQDDALPAFDRSATNGFRCAKYTGLASDAARAPVERLARDYKQEKPVVDEIFRVYQSLYAYERSDLKPRIESAEESEHWRKERISFDAAYSGERVVAYLFTPKNANPPYQTVVYFPTSMALMTTSIDAAEMLFVDFLMQSGRAVMYPIYKGTYERRLTGDAPQSLQLERELMLSWSKDLGRSIDYLQTRSDIDATKLAFYGFSLGARYGPLLTALEPRLKVSVLLAGGFVTTKLAPEVDPMNFAPRARIPVLMLNGRDDFLRPVEISQVPMFRLLGAPSKDKRHVLYDSGHIPPRIPVIKETLEWLDRYLGPV